MPNNRIINEVTASTSHSSDHGLELTKLDSLVSMILDC